MIIISHRANINSPNSAKFGENNPASIDYILSLPNNYYVEVDVFDCDQTCFYLGHDGPEYPVSYPFLLNKRLFLHAKTPKVLSRLLNFPIANVFSHNEDDMVLTSGGYIWTYPRATVELTEKSIAVMPERVKENWIGLDKCAGVCTDYIEKY